ncbi:MAG: hypothetical protein V3S48_04545 [Candidatus Neomarinimicrobiota bacterium]
MFPLFNIYSNRTRLKGCGSFFLSLYLGLFSVILPQENQGAKSSPIHPVMFVFSKAINDIQKEIPVKNPQLILPHVQAMFAACQDLNSVTPQQNFEDIEIFNKYRIDLKNQISSLLTHLNDNSTTVIPSLMGDIRNTCVSCHLQFRQNNDTIGLFPGRGNIISGSVNIKKLNGEYRTDRSNVVVFLDYVPGNMKKNNSQNNLTISQKNRQFIPRILPVVKGTTIDFPNDDLVFHNVFSLSRKKPFDLEIYPPGQSRQVTFDQPGWIKVYCNIHPQMTAHVIVLDNSFFSVSSENGFFVITDIPDGEYIIRAWHEFGSEFLKSIRVEGKTMSQIPIEIQENKKLLQHKNKFGKHYSGKY